MSVLLLNATYEPLRVISLKRAVALVLDEKAIVIDEDLDRPVRSESFSLGRPKVIRLERFVQIPFKARIPLNRRTLTARDHGECQYNDCSRVGNTTDHVHPRSLGGRHEWENVVLCCHRCNQAKGHRTLAELGWDLKRQPQVPTGTHWLVLGIAKKLDPEWEAYFPTAAAV